MLSIEDLAEVGITASAIAAQGEDAPDEFGLPWKIEEGSPTALVLARVWSGNPVTILQAPPGSGKTHSIITLVTHLVIRLNLNLTVVTPTRAQAASLLNRLVKALPADKVGAGSRIPSELLCDEAQMLPLRSGQGAGVLVQTLASASMRPPKCDVMIVEEAYQATFAEVSSAGVQALQLLLVGDPGQIGPVVTCNTSLWDGVAMAPHSRAPEALLARPDAKLTHLNTTWRLGPQTVEVISDLYDFPFTSVRPERALIDADGGVLPEIASLPFTKPTQADDPDLWRAVTDRVEALLTCSLRDSTGIRPLSEGDIAVVVARNSQLTGITAILSARGLSGVEVGTADRLQGGEWTAVVALDSAAGCEELSDHVTSLGRLCVMASRHSTHLTWVHDMAWRELLGGAVDLPETERNKAIAVRERLVAMPSVDLCVANGTESV